ncbi:hypothetical protein LXT12_26105 [Pelomonas sp. P7]|uniref:Uncharacterized protein n=1 Tax=Pelomonas caseinilytica TaxID=2906763 RepID=A0ABS8XM84_9BURK|nr:hypothetical protein [Pelomonas sp. P7]MCE4540712.1 hypothetical protein [Pelomonas sp. P7]
MHLAHAQTLEDAMGEVTYSLRKTQPGYRIVTQSGASLVCSSSAPIPTTDGLVLAPMLLGKRVATRRALSTGTYKSEWEVVESVQEVGLIDVQHITVGDRCFWAGESMGAFILHHNLKAEPDPGDPDPWWDDVRHEKPDSDSAMSAITPPPKPILGANIDALGASLTQAMAGFSLTSAATVAAAEGATSIEMRLLPPQQ